MIKNHKNGILTYVFDDRENLRFGVRKEAPDLSDYILNLGLAGLFPVLLTVQG